MRRARLKSKGAQLLCAVYELWFKQKVLFDMEVALQRSMSGSLLAEYFQSCWGRKAGHVEEVLARYRRAARVAKSPRRQAGVALPKSVGLNVLPDFSFCTCKYNRLFAASGLPRCGPDKHQAGATALQQAGRHRQWRCRRLVGPARAWQQRGWLWRHGTQPETAARDYCELRPCDVTVRPRELCARRYGHRKQTISDRRPCISGAA